MSDSSCSRPLSSFWSELASAGQQSSDETGGRSGGMDEDSPCSALVPNTRLIHPLDPSAGAACAIRSSSSRLAMASWRTRYSDRSAWSTSASVTMRLRSARHTLDS